jgi:hypothetical protein
VEEREKPARVSCGEGSSFPKSLPSAWKLMLIFPWPSKSRKMRCATLPTKKDYRAGRQYDKCIEAKNLGR